jgi:hypothetical protein
MADEAFALSPISARAAQPREEDYDAISEAFMETSRGRWFLGEYAKRNRNADTSMVLDAVARIEQAMAAQRQPAPDRGLAEALAAIRGALDEARRAASVALDRLAIEENLVPVRKGARVIREISWRWREIGADGRICDLLDSQVSAIEGACGDISSTDPRTALSAAFDLIEDRIAGLGDGDGSAAPAAEEAVRSPAPAPSNERPAPAAQTVPAAAATDNVDATAEVAEIAAEAADADDEALLEMIALEMAAPDPADNDDRSDADPDEIHLAEPPPADPVIVAREPEPIAEPVRPPQIQTSLQPAAEPLPEPSLGASLIAHGIVRRPHASHPDPLAPLRRMSQAEKIALFS